MRGESRCGKRKGAHGVAWARNGLKMRQMACKPGSVPWFPMVATIHLGRSLPNASRDRPGRRRESAFHPAKRPESVAPIWSCSRWGLPCRPRCRVRGALLPHPFTLTAADSGGLLSVALSLGSPPPDVIRHRASVEPGLSSPRLLAKRPPGHLTRPHGGDLGRARQGERSHSNRRKF